VYILFVFGAYPAQRIFIFPELVLLKFIHTDVIPQPHLATWSGPFGIALTRNVYAMRPTGSLALIGTGRKLTNRQRACI
jgi:hypothetical protein